MILRADKFRYIKDVLIKPLLYYLCTFVFGSVVLADEQLSLDDLIRNSRPVHLFLEVRPHVSRLPIYTQKSQESLVVTSLKGGDLVKVTMDVTQFVKRQRAIRDGKEFWHKLTVYRQGDRQQSVYLRETYEQVKGMRPLSTFIPVAKKERDDFEHFHFYESRLRENNGEVELVYQVSDHPVESLDNSDTPPMFWLPGQAFERVIEHEFVVKHSCIPMSWLTDDIEFTKYLASRLELLPTKGKTIKDKLSDNIFMQSKRKKMASLRRNWIKKNVISLSDDPEGDVIEREELDIGMDLGGRLGYETVSFNQRNAFSNVTYDSNNAVAGLSAYVPIYLDLEMSIKVDASFPAEQTFTDNIKQKSQDLDDLYQLTIDQLFLYAPQKEESSPWDVLYGFGFTYKGMVGRSVNIGYDTLLGVNLTTIFSYRRLFAGLKLAPLGNQFKLDLENRDIEFSLGLLMVDFEHYRDILFFVKANDLTFTGKEDSKLDLTRTSIGFSLGF